MKILDHLIAVLDLDTSVRDIRQGLFHTGVLTRNCGLAANLPRDALRQTPPLVKEPGLLLNRTPEELAKMAYSGSILEAAIGMAAINSLTEVDEASCLELNAADLLLEKGEGKRIAVVGHFPFLERLRKKAEDLWVIEKNPREGDYEEEQAGRLIPEADVVAITGTSLTNHTLEGLLSLCAPSAYVIMLGDTTPLSPVLFDYGLDALSGTRVADISLALSCVSQGANFRQILGTKRLTMLK
ncbi:MAG: Rossmann-like domain-containing protein [Thermodesulfobacteriota bacterium]